MTLQSQKIAIRTFQAERWILAFCGSGSSCFRQQFTMLQGNDLLQSSRGWQKYLTHLCFSAISGHGSYFAVTLSHRKIVCASRRLGCLKTFSQQTVLVSRSKISADCTLTRNTNLIIMRCTTAVCSSCSDMMLLTANLLWRIEAI